PYTTLFRSDDAQECGVLRAAWLQHVRRDAARRRGAAVGADAAPRGPLCGMPGGRWPSACSSSASADRGSAAALAGSPPTSSRDCARADATRARQQPDDGAARAAILREARFDPTLGLKQTPAMRPNLS